MRHRMAAAEVSARGEVSREVSRRGEIRGCGCAAAGLAASPQEEGWAVQPRSAPMCPDSRHRAARGVEPAACRRHKSAAGRRLLLRPDQCLFVPPSAIYGCRHLLIPGGGVYIHTPLRGSTRHGPT